MRRIKIDRDTLRRVLGLPAGAHVHLGLPCGAPRDGEEDVILLVETDAEPAQPSQPSDAAAVSKTATTAGRFYWLIERKAEPRYLGAWDRLREFRWTNDHNQALAFATREQADGAMMAIRELVPALFLVDIEVRPVEHGWMGQPSDDTGTWNRAINAAAERAAPNCPNGDACPNEGCQRVQGAVKRVLNLLKPEGTSPKDCGCAPGNCAEDEGGAVKGWRCRIKADATEGYHDDGMDDWPDSGDTRSEDR